MFITQILTTSSREKKDNHGPSNFQNEEQMKNENNFIIGSTLPNDEDNMRWLHIDKCPLEMEVENIR